MAAQYAETRICKMPIMVLVEKIRRINITGEGFQYRTEYPNQTRGVILTVDHGISFSSWGETITITLNPMEPGITTKVDIVSECALPTQIIDWGKNKQVVQQVFGYLGIS